MPHTRLRHHLGMLNDRHAWHSLTVAVTACVLSFGLVYAGYVVHVLRVARNAPCAPVRGDCVLVFGKHAPAGVPDADFQARLARAATLWAARPPRSLLLLGGGPLGARTEAELAREALFGLGVAEDAPLVLEDRSRDTWQNLRNARRLLADVLPGEGPHHVTLLSSRYHLARCALFARELGFDWELCAAEPRWSWRPAAMWQVAGEAAYVCWLDIGTRWARLIGHRGMLERLR
ncbi:MULTISPECIES: YdcF family protein [Luteimonas]|uniref:YdcF family protein n=1 Tax=Luteimonas TaxID=83614 RepID=UPI00130428C4|nr:MULTISPECIES: YdcF family protein [Luteimonas]